MAVSGKKNELPPCFRRFFLFCSMKNLIFVPSKRGAFPHKRYSHDTRNRWSQGGKADIARLF